MKKISKVLWLLSALCVIVCGLVSCKDSTAAGTGSTNNSGTVDEEVIYSPDVKTTLILGEGIDEDDANIKSIRNTYYKRVGKEIAVAAASAAPAAHEIIVGVTERELSKKAYRGMELLNVEGDDVSYVIYSDGKSVAIVFDKAAYGEEIAFAEAVGCFVEKYMASQSLKLESGVSYFESFDPIVRQKERDAETTERLWNFKISQLSAKAGNRDDVAETIVNELLNVRNLYNQNDAIVKWAANLYDPELGGFYYSNSARNSNGYSPDLESTSQALSLVELILSGYGGTLTDYFGEEIAAKFVAFAQDMQDPENGYFYHPHWKRDLLENNSARKTRDVYNAVNILKSFGASAKYATPDGIGEADGVTPVSKLSTPLRESVVGAVSKVTAVNSTDPYIPAHLKSADSFKSYLSSLNFRNNTKESCDIVYADISLYKKIDEMPKESGERYSLCTILAEYLQQTQNAATGLWASSSSIKTFAEIGEIASVVKVYDALGLPIGNYNAIFDTAAECLEGKDAPADISELAAVWTSLSAVVNNITSCKYDFYKYEVDESLKALCFKAPMMIRMTGSKLSLFLRNDGSFSTTSEGSQSEVYGMPVALPMSEEGDMSATLIATKNIWLSMFNTIGVGSVPLFSASDRMMFQKTLLDMGVIIKNEVKEIDPMDFEGYDVGQGGIIKHTTSSSASYAQIAAGPESQGKVLRLYSDDVSTDQFHFSIMSEVRSASCYTFELNICVNEETTEGKFANLYFYQDVYMLSLNLKGDTVSIYEESSRGSSSTYTHDTGARAKVGEWFKLKVEYYPGKAETVRIKIYFKGNCIAVTDNYFGSAKLNGEGIPSSDFSSFAIYGLNGETLCMDVDNIIVGKSYKTYTVETAATVNRNIDTPDKEQKVHDFESATLGGTPAGFTSANNEHLVVENNSEGGKSLAIKEGAGEVIIPLDQRGSGVNSAVISFDFFIDSSDAEVGAAYQISFKEYLYLERTFGAMQLIIAGSGNNKYATLAEVISGNVATPYSGLEIELDVLHKLRLQLFFNEGAMIVSVDGEIVGINTNILANCKRFYMGKTAIEAKTPAKSSSLLIDNLVSERAKSDFAEMTAPKEEEKKYDFSSSDGLTISGVSPADGALSFADAGSGESYVEIPVNVRVNVPTMAVGGFDVNLLDGETGSITIAFTNRDGKIIAAFDIVAGKNSATIYEHTSAGRYSAAIHTIEKQKFNISFEYSESAESFNILVDGEYVAASSLEYTYGSSAYNFERLRISTNGGASLAIDNLYAEEICGIFKAHSVSLINKDASGTKLTFETSSFASMPSNIELLYGGTKTTYKIRTDTVGEAVSKVLEANFADLEAASTVMIKTNHTAPGTNAVYFEANMMIKTISGIADIMLEPQTRDNTAYAFSLKTDGVGEPIYLYAGSAGGADYTVKLDVNEGEWFHIRIEYRDTPNDFDYDGYNDCVTRAYINGEQVGEEGHTLVTVGSSCPAQNIYRIRVRNVSNRICKLYLDNATLGQFDMDYVEPVPADTHTITYSPGIVTNKTQFTLGSKNSVYEIADLSQIDGQVGKVLRFFTAQDGEDKLVITPTQIIERPNAITFETDLKITPTTNTASFTLEPVTPKGNIPFKLTVTAAKDGVVTLTSYNSVGAKDPKISELELGETGEWIHLKVEYMNPRVDYTGDKKDDILIRIYVEDVLVATGYQPYKPSAYYEPAIIEKYLITTEADSEAEIQLDNTRFWQEELQADEASGNSGGADDNYLEGEDGGVDNSGWV